MSDNEGSIILDELEQEDMEIFGDDVGDTAAEDEILASALERSMSVGSETLKKPKSAKTTKKIYITEEKEKQ